MARIAVSRKLPFPDGRVWAALADLASHTNWMKDARSLAFRSDQRRGVGTRMEVKTVVGPLRTLDVVEVVGWDEGRSIEIEHRGMVTGTGTFRLHPEGGGTVVEWDEILVFPWWLGGPVTGWLARPVLARVWGSNLRRLEETLSLL